MDNLAYEGAWFSQAYSTCPTCIAARRCILTGQHARSHGMQGYAERVLWDNPVTLPQALRDAGYHTYFVGRDMHQYPSRKRFGYDHMVTTDDYITWLEAQLPYETGHAGGGIYRDNTMYAYGVMHNDYTAHPWELPEHLHFTNYTMMQAKKFMELRDPTQPFFLTISFLAPHPPLIPPRFYYDRYIRREPPDIPIGDWAVRPVNDGIGLRADGSDINKHPVDTSVVMEGELGREAMAAYYASINHIDDQIRRLVYGINGIDFNDTAVIYTSDHGELLGDHYLWRKSLPYNGSARIPFIVRLPNRVKTRRGVRHDMPVCLEDIMPTALDIADVQIPDTVDGRSLLPVMTDGAPPDRAHLHLLHSPKFHAIADGRFKYIWFADTGREQLFDIEHDKNEMRDLIHDPSSAFFADELRQTLINELRDAPEGFVSNGELIAGRPFGPLRGKV